MRLYFWRSGPCDGSCFSFAVDGRILPNGDLRPDLLWRNGSKYCSDGRRFVQLERRCTADEPQYAVTVDLPLGVAGLNLSRTAAREISSRSS